MTDSFTLVYGKSVYATAQQRDVGRGRCYCGRLELPAKTPRIPLFQFYCTSLLVSLPPPLSPPLPPRQPSVLGRSSVHICTCGGIRPILPWREEKQEKHAPPCRLAPPLRPFSLLEQCLPDIQATIFTLACSDGGKTGAAPALVSKNIAAQSKPYRFHSVCLPDHQSSVKFLQNTMELLGFKQRARVQNHQCHVQHFLISDGPINFKHVPKAPARTPSNLPNFDEEWYLTFYRNHSHTQYESPRPRNIISIRRIL
jgi:hypothetical protein